MMSDTVTSLPSNITRIGLRLAGEYHVFLYNTSNGEVYNPLFPGIRVVKVTLNCGHVLDHNTLSNIISKKIGDFELEIAKLELQKAVDSFNFKDYSDLF